MLACLLAGSWFVLLVVQAVLGLKTDVVSTFNLLDHLLTLAMSNKKRSNSAAPAPSSKDTQMVRSNTSVAMTKDAEYTGKGRYLPDGTLNIAGRWKSPGPGKYLLPPCVGYVNHDFTIGRRPAYSIGNKWSDLSELTRQICVLGLNKGVKGVLLFRFSQAIVLAR